MIKSFLHFQYMKGTDIMYEIREIELKNGEHIKKRLVITFADSAYEIVGTFLMSDAPMFQFELIEDVGAVLAGKREPFTMAGNRCELKVDVRETRIEDLFADDASDVSMQAATIPTTKLLEWMRMWREELRSFKA